MMVILYRTKSIVQHMIIWVSLKKISVRTQVYGVHLRTVIFISTKSRGNVKYMRDDLYIWSF